MHHLAFNSSVENTSRPFHADHLSAGGAGTTSTTAILEKMYVLNSKRKDMRLLGMFLDVLALKHIISTHFSLYENLFPNLMVTEQQVRLLPLNTTTQ